MDDTIIVKLLGLLEQLTEERGVPKETIVDKNIIKSDGTTFDDKAIKPTLTNVEKKRLTESFTLFNRLFFEYQKKVNPDEKQRTSVSSLAEKEKRVKEEQSTSSTSSGIGLMSMIVAGLTLLAGSVTGIVAALSGFFDDMGATDIVKIVSKLGFGGALKMMSKVFMKKFTVKLLKRLPIIGGIIGLGFAVKAFMDGDIFLGIAELISAVLNFVPVIGPILSLGADVLIAWAKEKGMFDEGGALSPENGWNTIKGWMADLGKIIMDNALYLPIIGTFKRFGMADEAFKSGNYGEALKQIGLGLFTLIPGGGALIKGVEVLTGFLNSDKSPEPIITEDSSWGERIMGWIRSKLKDLPWFIKKPLAWFGIISDDQVGEPSGVWQSIADGAQSGFDQTKKFVGDAWDSVKGPIADSVDVIGSFAIDTWNTTKEYATDAWNTVAEEAPKIWDSIKNVSSKAWDLTKEAGTWFVEAITDMASKTKDLITSWIPKIVETVVGITDSAMSVLKNIANTIGGWISNLFTSEEQNKLNEAQKTFNDTTDDMANNASKVGSEMEVLVKNSYSTNAWMGHLHQASEKQVELLSALVNIGTYSLKELKRMSGSGGGTTVVNQSLAAPTPTERPMVTAGNNRSGYVASPYALA